MYIPKVVASLLLCTFCSTALGNMVSSYFQDKRYDFEFSCDVLSTTPAWQNESDEPPLPPRAAVRVATTQLAALMQNAERWRLSQISLRSACDRPHWFYVVTFAPPPNRPDGGAYSPFELVVLMNGQAVEPRVSKWHAMKPTSEDTRD
jgi:hypothetical protein